MSDESETIDLLRDSVAGTVPFDGRRIRSLRRQSPDHDRAVWRRMAEQGWLSILVPEADGGLGLGLEAAAAVAGELGGTCAPEPFVMAGVLTPSLLAQGGETARRDVLPAVLSGEKVLALAWQPADGSLDPAATDMVLTRGKDGATLSGQARFVVPAQADAWLVTARDGDALALLLIDGGEATAALSTEPAPDGTASGWLRLSGLALPGSSVVMEGPEVGAAVQAALDRATIVQSAELSGLMQRSLAMTLDYLKTRQQFGAAIGSFQALQHRCVDLFVQQELARHATAAAVRAADAGAAGKVLSRAASSAKSRAGLAAMRIATEAIQLHGAIGVTDEYDLGLYVNRIVRLAASLGNAAWHRHRFDRMSEGATA